MWELTLRQAKISYLMESNIYGVSQKSTFVYYKWLQATNLLNMYTEQHKMHNCSHIIKLSNLIKSQPGAEMTKAKIIFKDRSSTLCLGNTYSLEDLLESELGSDGETSGIFFKCLA